jgi:hypothetical protein
MPPNGLDDYFLSGVNPISLCANLGAGRIDKQLQVHQQGIKL